MMYAVESASGGFAVRRDGQAMKTPAGKLLVVPTKILAEAIAAEWREAGPKTKPEKLPMTQFAATSIDLVVGQETVVVAGLMEHADSDLLCHRADQPDALVERQEKTWQPWLDWAKKGFGAELNVSTGIMPVGQSEAAMQALQKAVSGYDAFRLAGLREAAGLAGSLVLGLALAEGAATPEQVFQAAELETLFQVEQWGEDPVTDDRHKGLKADIKNGAKWFSLLRG